MPTVYAPTLLQTSPTHVQGLSPSYSCRTTNVRQWLWKSFSCSEYVVCLNSCCQRCRMSMLFQRLRLLSFPLLVCLFHLFFNIHTVFLVVTPLRRHLHLRIGRAQKGLYRLAGGAFKNAARRKAVRTTCAKCRRDDGSESFCHRHTDMVLTVCHLINNVRFRAYR